MIDEKRTELISRSRFLQACAGRATDQTPIWMMRQAGRYMPEFHAVRGHRTMLEVINSPELSAEITLQPIEKFDFDAAIIFSDILPPLVGMGLSLAYGEGEGPVIHNRLDSPKSVDLLATPPAAETMSGTLEAIRIVANALALRSVPLIGFAGAPFTLASYAIEGSGSNTYGRTKAFMYTQPAAWQRLMDKLATVQTDYLIEQAKAGASALQLFDSWAGIALGKSDYVQFVQPYNRKIFEAVKQRTDVPLINFSTGTFAYLEEVTAAGGDVVGVDWRMPLGEAWEKIGFDTPIMGNLDPIALLAPWPELKARIDIVLEQAGRRVGHIFNLGHGILPNTPMENVQRTIDYVRERTSQKRGEVFGDVKRPKKQRFGVLMMAYGGPSALDEIPGYLADIRNGRPTTKGVLEEITNNYALIGGKSPLLAYTKAQVEAVASHFDQDIKFYVGMRHWAPWIEDAVKEMIADGVTHAVSMVLAPHFSKLSIAKYQAKIAAGLNMHRGDIQFEHIKSYHDAPNYIRALANRVRTGFEHWPQDEWADVHVVFSAHSLPVRILKTGDPYDRQLRETATLIAQEAKLREDQWSWSYQSAGRSPEPWLGPQLEEYLPELAKKGVKKVVSIPVGFVCDHVEILYDIDIEAQNAIKDTGMTLVRPEALNTDPLFIEQLANLIKERLENMKS